MRTILTTLHSKYIHPSLALPYLAAYCDAAADNACGELLIREFTLHEPRENILAQLLSENPDVIAFSVYLWNRTTTLELVDAIHCVSPSLRIVLGGPEVSFEDDTIWQRHPGISAIVRGEGEQPLRQLLGMWQQNQAVKPIPRVDFRDSDLLVHGPDSPPLTELDDIPSPYEQGRIDIQRGFVYYETSRGCPYRCSFCMSALDDRVRSFSMPRIQRDLRWLMEQRIPKIKLVDRTFNYDPRRALELFEFILRHNHSSHFHFEIGAHLLDEPTLKLLEQVPEDMFQFEIGVQSTLPETLQAVQRTAPQQKLYDNIRHLLRHTRIHLHLDLIGGLPEENLQQMLAGIDQVMDLNPGHLQIETVKLLPGAPMRRDAETLRMVFDPHPPYRVLRTPQMSFDDLEHVRAVSRLLDLTWNCGRGQNFLRQLADDFGSIAQALSTIAANWQQQGVLRFPLGQKELFEHLARFVTEQFTKQFAKPSSDQKQLQRRDYLLEVLGHDYARHERLTPNNVPPFFDLEFNIEEQQQIKEAVKEKLDQIKGQGIKLQHFAAHFRALEPDQSATIHLFFYLTGSGRKMEIEEQVL
ncbi:MAG: DUF4080 domain-containing protein [Desulfuromonas sp.]|nr:DUF4080 domain-containing protein [Desulfuromonas sp.]